MLLRFGKSGLFINRAGKLFRNYLVFILFVMVGLAGGIRGSFFQAILIDQINRLYFRYYAE